MVIGQELSSNLRPRYWDDASGLVVDDLPDGTPVPGGNIRAVSDDGRTLGGLADRGMRTSAWIYSETQGFEYLDIPGTTRFSAGIVNSLSADGEHAVGYVGALWSQEPPEVLEWGSTAPMRWPAAGGFDRLALPSEFSAGRGQDLSLDGSIVVGYLTDSSLDGHSWKPSTALLLVLGLISLSRDRRRHADDTPSPTTPYWLS